MQSLPRKHHASLHQLFIELAHLGEESFARHHARLRVLGGFDQNHESHRSVSFLGFRAGLPGVSTSDVGSAGC
jgi:hypothetical protein